MEWLSDGPVIPILFCVLPCSAAGLSLVVGIFRIGIHYYLRYSRRRRFQEMLPLTRNLLYLGNYEFERYVGILFKKSGYKVRHTGKSGDRGIDLIVAKDGRRAVVQCKKYTDTNKVSPAAVRELIGSMHNARVTRGYLVTTSDFTSGARRAARESRFKVVLINGGRLVRIVKKLDLPGRM